MMFTETGSPNSNTDGGYVRAAVRDFTAANKTVYMDLLNSLHVNNDKSNGGKAGVTMQEAYYYFAGQNPRSGNNKVKTDYTGNNCRHRRVQRDLRPAGERAAPVGRFACRRPAVQQPGHRRQLRPELHHLHQQRRGAGQQLRHQYGAHSALAAEGGDTTTIPISPSGSMSNVADEWARFMEVSPYGITTYTVDVDKVTTGQGPGWTALLKSMAGVSRGKYFDVGSGRRRQ